MQLWHIVKIHPIDTGNKGERNENSGNNGQDFHNFIHLVAYGRHVHVH